MKKFGRFIRNLFEVYIPCIAFITLFGVFLLQIFFRYVLRNPLTWTMDVISVLFLWLSLFGALYACRTDRHIRFTLFLDKAPRKVGKILSLCGSLFLIVIMCICLVPTIRYVNFMQRQSSAVLHINLRFVYSPYIIMLIGSIIYHIVWSIKDFLAIKEDTAVQAKGEEVKA